MRKFRFNLEKVLGYRENEEQQVRTELKAALVQVAGIEEELDSLRGNRSEGECLLLEEQSRESLEVSRIIHLQAGLERIDRQTEGARLRLLAAENLAEKVRQRFQEARMKTESLRRIRARQRKRHDLRNRREELNRIDEVAVTRFLRQGADVDGR